LAAAKRPGSNWVRCLARVPCGYGTTALPTELQPTPDDKSDSISWLHDMLWVLCAVTSPCVVIAVRLPGRHTEVTAPRWALNITLACVSQRIRLHRNCEDKEASFIVQRRAIHCSICNNLHASAEAQQWNHQLFF